MSGAEPAIVVEPTLTGRYAVTVRPFLARPKVERAFSAVWQALEYADLLSGEFGWPLIDRTAEGHV